VGASRKKMGRCVTVEMPGSISVPSPTPGDQFGHPMLDTSVMLHIDVKVLQNVFDSLDR
jgi:hypothetical protein